MATSISVRRLDSNGDLTFGNGLGNYITNTQAVAQILKTRLLLFTGEWWADLNDGLPLWTNILGVSSANISAITLIIQNRILGTPQVLNVTDLAIVYNSAVRSYSFSCTVTTSYSTTITVANSPVNLPTI